MFSFVTSGTWKRRRRRQQQQQPWEISSIRGQEKLTRKTSFDRAHRAKLRNGGGVCMVSTTHSGGREGCCLRSRERDAKFVVAAAVACV